MSELKGTNVAAPVLPFTSEDTYATHDSLYGKGGWKEVETIDERDAIPLGRLRRGCVCYVAELELLYTWDGAEWVELPLGTQLPGGVVMKVKSLVPASLRAVEGKSLSVGFRFTSVYTDDGNPTGDGRAVWTVDEKEVAAQTIRQGENWFELTPYLKRGTHPVSVSVTDSAGSDRVLHYTVEVIELSLTSSFDATQVSDGPIVYRYTPVGALEKTVHFVVDGAEAGAVTTSLSNRQLSYTLPAQPHGCHTLEVFLTASADDLDVRTEPLLYELICIEPGDTRPIVASAFRPAEVLQFETLAIPFQVYDPAASVASVVLAADGQPIATQRVDRTLQTWHYRPALAGAHTLSIVCGAVSRTFRIEVVESPVVSRPETEGLALYLTASGRSNNDEGRENWSFGTTQAHLAGFNFTTDGWLPGADGSVALRVSGDARVRIPFRIFAEDFRWTGKTVEFEFATTEVTDYEPVLIDCLSGDIGLQVTAQKARFSSEQTPVETWFKENERVRIAFVAESRTEHRLLSIYINGILSGVAQYPEEDNFMQKNPVDLTIGSNATALDLYTLRVYDSALSAFQLLDNFIGDLDDFDRKLALSERNRIYDAYGNIRYEAILENLPCLTVTGTLPAYKGDKKTVSAVYEDGGEPANSFTAEGVSIDVQGTSSQYYPRKNFKLSFKKGFTLTASGEATPEYALRPDSIPANVFTFKADFAESSGTHNTGMAKVIDRLLKARGLLTPPQRTDARVRTTVDGFPIALFHRASEDAERVFVGKYNFNNDKSTYRMFGFGEGTESWEFCNNTSDRMLFKVSDYSTPQWMNDFEARYPDDDALNAAYAAGKIPENLKRLTDWVASTQGNPEKFKAEVRQYFDLDNLLAYYLITELFAMVDQRAKNMFLTTWGPEDGSEGYIWRILFYDNDTCFGINNEGLIAFSYPVEYHDAEGTQQVFNGEQSVLWNNVEACFAPEIETLYRAIRSEGQLSYDSVMAVLNDEQCRKWCEAIYNADARFKYIDPLIQEGNGSYLYAAQGSREEHRKWWTYNRFRYMDSKYNAGDFLSDYATMRLYTPADWTAVPPDADFTVVPFADQYVRVKYGSYSVALRGKKDVPLTIAAPAIRFNDTETIIYGASRLKSLGSLAGKYAGTIDVSKAVRLTELLVGSGEEGFRNTNLAALSVGANKMLRTVDVRNCPNLRQPLDLGGCMNLERVYATGTSLTSVVLPPAGILRELSLPATLTNLTLRNQPNLTDLTFTLAGVERLTTLRLENINRVNVFALIDRCLALPEVVLARVRLTGISGGARGLDTLFGLTAIAGMDENGNNCEHSVVTGAYHASGAVYISQLEAVRAAYPELTVTYDKQAIDFADKTAERICSEAFGEKDGYLSPEEAAKVVSIDEGIFGGSALSTFEELGAWFTSLAILRVRAFNQCVSLGAIELPEELEEIQMSAFNQCENLAAVTLPASVAVLGRNVFFNCTKLAVCICRRQVPPEMGSACFYGTSKELLIYVPDESVELYKAAPNWSVQKERIRPLSERGAGRSGYRGASILLQESCPK